MKNNPVILKLSLLALGGLLASTAWQSLPNRKSSTLRVAGSSVNIDIQPSPANTALPKPTDNAALNASAILVIAKQGLTAEIREYDLNPDYPTVTVCTDLPSIADWLPIFTASFNGKEIGIWQVMLIDPDGAAPEKKNRCYLAMLVEGNFKPGEKGKLIFRIEYFQMSIPELLPDELLIKAKNNLKDKGLDIDFEMQNVDHGQIVIIKTKPSTLTDEQAYQAIQEAIAQAPEKIQGPWTFVIDVNP
ncbi:MAG: hypothetical protein IT310_13540 [Anaerolineales bacterium]|nr:hypothetical protein [Anaerolineales bacterium]